MVESSDIAIIPARGGSKRIPGKNFRNFAGRPMLERTIELALSSGAFKSIFVSSDDPRGLAIAIEMGVEPLKRCSNLSDDFAPTASVVQHALRFAQRSVTNIVRVCCIYPCTPLLDTETILAVRDLLDQSSASFAYPVIEYPHPIQRAFRLSTNLKVEFREPANELARTNDLESFYHDAGQLYWGKKDSWLNGEKMHTGGVGLVVPKGRFIDIDTPEDWDLAEVLWRSRQHRTGIPDNA